MTLVLCPSNDIMKVVILYDVVILTYKSTPGCQSCVNGKLQLLPPEWRHVSKPQPAREDHFKSEFQIAGDYALARTKGVMKIHLLPQAECKEHKLQMNPKPKVDEKLSEFLVVVFS